MSQRVIRPERTRISQPPKIALMLTLGIVGERDGIGRLET